MRPRQQPVLDPGEERLSKWLKPRYKLSCRRRKQYAGRRLTVCASVSGQVLQLKVHLGEFNLPIFVGQQMDVFIEAAPQPVPASTNPPPHS
jgi:hypothetical protein